LGVSGGRSRAERYSVGNGGSRPVSRVLSWTAIHLGCTSPCISSDLPGNPCGPHGADPVRLFPYLVLLRVGFTLPPMLPPARCALTAPFHPYRPAGSGFRRSVFCGTFRGLAPPRRYLAPCPAEPGLSSPATKPRERLSGRLPSQESTTEDRRARRNVRFPQGSRMIIPAETSGWLGL